VESIVSATEARIRFGELMQQAVKEGKPIIVERGGKAHVVVLSMDAYQRLLQGQQREEWQSLVDRARTQIGTELAGRALPRPEEILQQIREERDAYLLDLR
jgi:prevent-host-death family protein